MEEELNQVVAGEEMSSHGVCHSGEKLNEVFDKFAGMNIIDRFCFKCDDKYSYEYNNGITCEDCLSKRNKKYSDSNIIDGFAGMNIRDVVEFCPICDDKYSYEYNNGVTCENCSSKGNKKSSGSINGDQDDQVLAAAEEQEPDNGNDINTAESETVVCYDDYVFSSDEEDGYGYEDDYGYEDYYGYEEETEEKQVEIRDDHGHGDGEVIVEEIRQQNRDDYEVGDEDDDEWIVVADGYAEYICRSSTYEDLLEQNNYMDIDLSTIPTTITEVIY